MTGFIKSNGHYTFNCGDNTFTLEFNGEEYVVCKQVDLYSEIIGEISTRRIVSLWWNNHGEFARRVGDFDDHIDDIVDAFNEQIGQQLLRLYSPDYGMCFKQCEKKFSEMVKQLM